MRYYYFIRKTISPYLADIALFVGCDDGAFLFDGYGKPYNTAPIKDYGYNLEVLNYLKPDWIEVSQEAAFTILTAEAANKIRGFLPAFEPIVITEETKTNVINLFKEKYAVNGDTGIPPKDKTECDLYHELEHLGILKSVKFGRALKHYYLV